MCKRRKLIKSCLTYALSGFCLGKKHKSKELLTCSVSALSKISPEVLNKVIDKDSKANHHYMATLKFFSLLKNLRNNFIS